MDAEEACPGCPGQGAGGGGGGIPLFPPAVGERAEKALPGGTHQNRTSENPERPQALQELDVLLRGLAEAQARVNHDPLSLEAGIPRRGQCPGKLFDDSGEHAEWIAGVPERPSSSNVPRECIRITPAFRSETQFPAWRSRAGVRKRR
jgi:hypothetical protein